MSNPIKRNCVGSLSAAAVTARRIRFWNLHDSGASIGEIAAAFGVTVQHVQSIWSFPTLTQKR